MIRWEGGWNLICDSLGHSEPTIQTESPSVQPFLHRWPQSVPVLYNGLCLPLEIAPSCGDPVVPWAHPSPQPNGISIGSAVYAGLSGVTDRPRYTLSEAIGRIFVRTPTGSSCDAALKINELHKQRSNFPSFCDVSYKYIPLN